MSMICPFRRDVKCDQVQKYPMCGGAISGKEYIDVKSYCIPCMLMQMIEINNKILEKMNETDKQ